MGKAPDFSILNSPPSRRVRPGEADEAAPMPTSSEEVEDTPCWVPPVGRTLAGTSAVVTAENLARAQRMLAGM